MPATSRHCDRPFQLDAANRARQVLNARITQLQSTGAPPQSVASAVEDLNDYYERGGCPTLWAAAAATSSPCPPGMQLRTMRIGTLEEEKKELIEAARKQSRQMWRVVVGVFGVLCVMLCVLAEFSRPGLVEELAIAYWSQVMTAVVATIVARRCARPPPPALPAE